MIIDVGSYTKIYFWTITKLFSANETAKTYTSEKGTVVSYLFIPWVKCGSSLSFYSGGLFLFVCLFVFWCPSCEIKLAAC